MEYDKYYINLTRFHDSLENAISEHLECLKFQTFRGVSAPEHSIPQTPYLYCALSMTVKNKVPLN